MKIFLLFLLFCISVFPQDVPHIFVHTYRKMDNVEQVDELINKDLRTILKTKSYKFVTELQKVNQIKKHLEQANFWKQRFKNDLSSESRDYLKKQNISYLLLGEFTKNPRNSQEITVVYRILPSLTSAPSEILTQTGNWATIKASWSEFIIQSAFFKKLSSKNIPLEVSQLDEIGWFGETMPSGMKRTQVAGEYVWEHDQSLMVYVPAGTYYQQKDFSYFELNNLPAFYMDKWEISVSQYEKFLQKNTQNPAGLTKIHDDSSILKQVNDSSIGHYPMVNVSWMGAKEYAQYYKKRLPSIQHWQKASKGGLQIPNWNTKQIPIQLKENTTPQRLNPWGNESVSDLFFRANLAGELDGYITLAPIDAFIFLSDSPYQISQLVGNVWEWMDDGSIEYGVNLKFAVGGSWATQEQNKLNFLYIKLKENSFCDDLGFRCIVVP